MGKKNRSRQRIDPGQANAFHVNPFANLRLELPRTSDPPLPVVEKLEPETNKPGTEFLPAADRELLKAFDQDTAIVFTKRAPTVTLHLERRSRGKRVTCVKGVKDLDALELMELVRELRQRLGIGARFREEILELQGDQRRRATDWFQSQGYTVRISS